MKRERIELQSVSLQIHRLSGDLSGRAPLLFLHGFTGSGGDWYPVMDRLEVGADLIALDLIGHGESDAPDRSDLYTIHSQLRQLRELLDRLSVPAVYLLGYSMGGRIALSFADAFPEFVEGLILESTTAGLQSEEERTKRIEHDNIIAAMIRDEGMDFFVDYSMKIPLFSTQSRLPKDVLNGIRDRKIKNSVTGLVNSLLSAGTGKMNPLWEKLPNLHLPVLLITGSLDGKFTDINAHMQSLLPDASHVVIKDAGHAVHLEKPGAFVSAARNFIQNISLTRE